jgi:serine/threonine protein kinase
MQPPIPIGTVLQNRYRIIQILGQGGFGRTYLSEDQRRFNEPCAIKELISVATEEAWLKAQELFQREAAVLYQIQHPQIPQFRERFEEDQRLFLVQEYVAGKTYQTLLDERKAAGSAFTEAEVLQLMLSLLPVLEHIHSRGIIHRDISPDNIILRDSDQKPVLIDFGVVKELATRLQSLTNATPLTTVGKLGYSPSEQMQTGRAYPSSDLYALAVTAIVLLTGKEPNELFDENLLVWNWQRWVGVNPRFAQVLNRMLSYIPGDRFQNAGDVAQILQSIDQVKVAPKPDLSNVQTIAVGRPDVVQPPLPNLPNKPDPVIPPPNTTSVLDNPLAIGAIGSAVVILAGFGSWAVVSSIRNQSRGTDQLPPQNFPSPVLTSNTTFTPIPTSTPTPTSIPTLDKPVIFSRRLNFGASNTANVEGNLKANQVIQYTFSGKEGQQLVVLLEQEGAILTILSPNGRPIDNGAKGVTFYQGSLPVSGRYTVELVPASGFAETDYSLKVQLENLIEPTPTLPPIENLPTQQPTVDPTPVPVPPVNTPKESPTDILPTIQFPTPTPEAEQKNVPTVEETP